MVEDAGCRRHHLEHPGEESMRHGQPAAQGLPSPAASAHLHSEKRQRESLSPVVDSHDV
jgi:hypothetical protein